MMRHPLFSSRFASGAVALATVLLLLLTSIEARAQSDPEQALYTRLERAATTGDRPALRELRTELQQSLATLPPSARRRYALAYADWRLEHLKSKEDRKEEYFKEAQKQLELTLAQEPTNADARALLSGILGEKIGQDPAMGQILGPKAGALLERAAKDDPLNPRVALQRGLSALFTPEAFGGSLVRAESEERRALALFAQEPATKPWPNWGRLDAMAWLGQILERRGDLEGARRVYQQALAIEPEYGWVRHKLLPELEARLAAK